MLAIQFPIQNLMHSGLFKRYLPSAIVIHEGFNYFQRKSSEVVMVHDSKKRQSALTLSEVLC
jgi:hypothetical protein